MGEWKRRLKRGALCGFFTDRRDPKIASLAALFFGHGHGHGKKPGLFRDTP